LAEGRASQQWEALRGQLQTRFDQWLESLEEQLQEPAPSVAQVPESVGHRRHALPGSLRETRVDHGHRGEYPHPQTHCPPCARRLPARGLVRRPVATLVGAVHLERPSCYCPACQGGQYRLDAVGGLVPGRLQRDGQQAAATLVTAVPYDEAQRVLGAVTGSGLGSERRHPGTKQAAAGLTVLEVTPARDEIERRMAEVAAGRWRRPVLVLAEVDHLNSP
jgi:hypothetical protein